jgi:hypothetical protein
MKSTNNPQITEDMNKKAIALTEQDYIIEELSDEAASAVSGGAPLRYVTLDSPEYKQLMQKDSALMMG